MTVPWIECIQFGFSEAALTTALKGAKNTTSHSGCNNFDAGIGVLHAHAREKDTVLLDLGACRGLDLSVSPQLIVNVANVVSD